MFFEIMRIVKENRPKVLFLENVRHLIKHDDGRTFATVKQSIEDQGYSFNYKIVKASDFNLPQHRPRVFIVAFSEEVEAREAFAFPKPVKNTYFMTDVFGEPCNGRLASHLGLAEVVWYKRPSQLGYLPRCEGLNTSTEAKNERLDGFDSCFRTQTMSNLDSLAANAVQATCANLQILKKNDYRKGKWSNFGLIKYATDIGAIRDASLNPLGENVSISKRYFVKGLLSK